MMYLTSFTFPDAEQETEFFIREVRRTCYDSYYPFQVLTRCGLTRLDFEPVTVLCGGNGCGKSTALNVMAEKLRLRRDTLCNRTDFFSAYTGLCDAEVRGEVPEGSRIITSDDVFDFMLNLRAINQGIDQKREALFEDYRRMSDTRPGHEFRFQLRSMDDYETLRDMNRARSTTQSQFVRERLIRNAREHSNGESALMYFQEKLRDGGLYLLDEPENSLSPEKQLALVRYLEESVRFFDCQLVIATHSPLLLGMRGAKVYHLDECPARVRRWTELPEVRVWRDFFREHEREFEDD